MAPEQIVNVRYMVHEVEASVRFYTENFGFKVISRAGAAFADLQRGNLRLLVSGPESSAGRPMPDGARPMPGGWNRIHFVVENIEEETRRLQARGAKFRNEIVRGPGGAQILVEDPSGNLIEIFEPKRH